ncbi:1,2-phenylacetyl-CoA epoxidase subunit PaaB [Streptomyces sp. NPDC092296]|uniref:1,2-phenylacetyl-CoA epoxidase subunit PaaB n=1 Tax=Streptomyces sp. NPDC092296 TaxID=3366012 RepID=UPI0038013267
MTDPTPTPAPTGTATGIPTGTTREAAAAPRAEWPLYEVFVRSRRGLNHVHVGSLHAADERMALLNARDLYTRRNEGVSLWVVRSDAITASNPDEKDPFFAPSGDKVYRHPTFYDIPEDVPHI